MTRIYVVQQLRVKRTLICDGTENARNIAYCVPFNQSDNVFNTSHTVKTTYFFRYQLVHLHYL